jgi:carboxylesterase type B
MLIPELTVAGEDCLTLNVWTGELGGAARPVMVWIPGGAFQYHATGASPWYDGARFAQDGVVCVTINYRAAVEGLLYLDDGIANVGLLDQIAALEWVQENIAAFGGDPGNVTIFGESAGAVSAALLLTAPRAARLFRRAVCQSGAAHMAISADSAQRVGRRLAEILGVEPSRDAIAALPVERLLAAQEQINAEVAAQPDPARWGPDVALSMMAWQPVIDGDVIPARPIERIAAGAGAGIAAIVGTNSDEHRTFLGTMGNLDQTPVEAVAGMVATYGLPVETALAAYQTAHPGASAGDLLAAVMTDWWWRIPAIRLADARAQAGATTFMYEFAWRTPAFGGAVGAGHSLEIPFVFDTLGGGPGALWGDSPPQALADAMHAAWVAFATHGDPGWPKYDLRRRATMRFDVAPQLLDDPYCIERQLWAGVR